MVSGTARHADLPGWLAAGKTGTSQDYRDAWFIGYTPHLVTGVWLGNDDNSPTRKATGGGLPVDIWSRFMKVAHQGVAAAASRALAAPDGRRRRQLPDIWYRPIKPAPRAARSPQPAERPRHLAARQAVRPALSAPTRRNLSAAEPLT